MRDLLNGHNKTKLIIIIAAAVALLAAIYCVLNYFERYGEVEDVTGDGFAKTVPDITYEGETYSYKGRLKNIAILGVDDKDIANEKNGVSYMGGRTDMIFLVSIDYANRTVTPIQITRDAMVEYAPMDSSGNRLGSDYESITFAYSYGDGGRISANNTKEALSNLLYGTPITDCFSIQVDGVAPLNDAVGGVTVTVEDDFSNIDPSLTQGATVTLTGTQAAEFVRSRTGVGDETNEERMSRHRTYLTSFMDTLRPKLEEDRTLISTLLDGISEYSYSSMSAATIASIINNTADFEVKDIITPTGTTVEDKTGHNWHLVELDDEQLKKIIVNTFYEKVEE
ncbi:MAG: LCP family protein [Clostridia bacterium]|nr:LCP family protein [Clostridia bacterium]